MNMTPEQKDELFEEICTYIRDMDISEILPSGLYKETRTFFSIPFGDFTIRLSTARHTDKTIPDGHSIYVFERQGNIQYPIGLVFEGSEYPAIRVLYEETEERHNNWRGSAVRRLVQRLG